MNQAGIAFLRVVVGVVFCVHGGNKFAVGFEEVAADFAGYGIPWPLVSGVAVALVELLCGAALALGLWTRWVSAPLMADMAVAMIVAHRPNGFFIDRGGYEYTLVLFAALLLFALAGGGTPALEQWLRRRGRKRTPTR